MAKSGRKNSSRPFWERKALDQMNPHEWEQLCDGCGKCCCFRTSEQQDTGKRFACELLDPESCGCSNYSKRKSLVPDCFQITPKNIHSADWLPNSCSYRLLAQGKPLPRWHHLISKSKETVHSAGKSMRGNIVDEKTT